MSSGDRHHIPLGVLYALATSLVASSAAAVVKYLSLSLSPWFIVWVQYGLCLLLMFPWLIRHGPRALASRRYSLHLIRAAGGWVGFTAYYLAIPHIPLVDASLLRAAAPLWVPLVVFILFQERVPASRWVVLAGGFAGVMLILNPRMDGIGFGHALGALAGLALAVSMTGTRALSSSEPAQRVLVYYFGFAFLASTPAGLLHLTSVPVELWLPLMYVGVSIFLTMVLYTRAYTHAPTTVVAPLGYVAVPIAALLDWTLWNHIPQAHVLAGSLVVIASGILAVALVGRRRSEH